MAPTGGGLEDMPAHFRREREALGAAGISHWHQLADLPGEQLRDLAKPGGASEARLLRLRAQARLMAAAGLSPEHASLLLHAGIAEVRALAQADPQRLQLQVNRLRLRLLGRAANPLPLSTVKGWILSATTSRSGN